MRIFVTGGSGYIGNTLVDRLLARKHEVLCLVKPNSPHMASLQKRGVQIVLGDTRNKESLAAMKGCDAVFANASIYKFGPPKDIRETLYEVNVNGNMNTIEQALSYGVPRIVFTSSVQALGSTTKLADEEYVSERIPQYATLYERTKYETHMKVLKLIKEQGAPITIGMPTAVFGLDDPSDLGTSVRDMIRGTLFALPHTEAKINFIHVEDTAEGLVLCLEKGKREAYLLGGPEENTMSLEEFFRRMAKLGGIDPPKRTVSLKTMVVLEKFYRIKGFLTRKRQVFNPEVIANFKFSSTVSCEKAFRELDYKPKPIETRMKETMEYYINQAKA